MAALLTAFAPNASAEEVPEWIERQVAVQAESLAQVLDLPRVPFLTLDYDRETPIEGLRVLDADAGPEKATIRFRGDWTTPDADMRDLIARNLAHELAHVWQYRTGQPSETRFLHEGFAEAMAVEALIACGDVCGGDPAALAREQEARCRSSMSRGPLIAEDSRVKGYGCGAVVTLAAARKAEMSVQAFYLAFAATKRSNQDFLDVARERAGQDFAVAAFSFLNTDHSLAKPETVIRRLKRGTL
ncbi:hypothetical protein HK107_10135 [Parvularcula sp. ZS-1/3]|uniref:DUF2268 domain-containing protein n=1 Tax=Parvularcula mediterranea TaxID=2732508 RepID=A0A7Y3RM82_9PROT|nr:hypothetical protein [Parvularcula mediterranea]NNU16679.1 hypothetical protein [Parvularcula mediterranea]